MWWSWWGMTWFWWAFWVIAIVSFAMWAIPQRSRNLADDPLRRLAQRYADGEISSAEYDERRGRLERDLRAPETLSRPDRQPPVTPPQPA